MKISAKGRYGLATMITLGLNHPNKLSSSLISQDLGISKIYLEQVLMLLKKAGLVDSEKGSNGGYTLSKPVSEISSYDILYAIEANLFARNLNSTTNMQIESVLNSSLFDKVDNSLETLLSNITLESLVNEVKKSNDIDMYYI